MTKSTRSLYFIAPRKVAIETEPLPRPGPDEVLIEAVVSAISAGTELEVYRGVAPQWRQRMNPVSRLFHDDTSAWRWPARYGYAVVGRVIEVGAAVEGLRTGEAVFAYAPHGEYAIVRGSALVSMAELDNIEVASLFASMNTAYNGLLDANIPLGADVVVMGLGVIGQITVRLLQRNGARSIVAIDGNERRRAFAIAGGATHVIDPNCGKVAEQVRELTAGRGADAVIEVSGASGALQEAIRTVGFNGLVVTLSWYGDPVQIANLSMEFHHNRIRIVSSQVGAVNPFLGTLWSGARRSAIALEYLHSMQTGLAQLITHRVALGNADKAYEMLDRGSNEAMQVLIDYRLE